MNRTDLADLSAFLVVAEERSFTRRRARLGVSQSALSHTMRRLEERMGVRLLTRTTRSVSVTEAGEIHCHLSPAMDQIEQGITQVSQMRDKPSGTIRHHRVRPRRARHPVAALARILPDMPDVHVEVSIDNGFVDIVEERFDAGIRLGEAIARDMIAVRISPAMRMACVGSPAYLARHPAPQTPHDLAQHRCINMRMATSGGLYAWEFEKGDRVMNVRVEGQLTFRGSGMVIEAAKAGFGLAMTIEDIAAPATPRPPGPRAGGLDAALCRLSPLLPQPPSGIARLHGPGRGLRYRGE
jgi:DNA-binding transcriptional LysR family regulator